MKKITVAGSIKIILEVICWLLLANFVVALAADGKVDLKSYSGPKIIIENDLLQSTPVTHPRVYLKAPVPIELGVFGQSVAISGNTLVVGGHGSVNDDIGRNAEQFGHSVDISGETIVIGAPRDYRNSQGTPCNCGLPGGVHVFKRSGGIWAREAYLKASNYSKVSDFGYSVSISGDSIIVGTFSENSSSTGVNGDQSNQLARNSGAAYIFVRNGTSWSQEAYLKASNTDSGDKFGTSVSVDGNYAVVGAVSESSSATHPGGNEDDNSASQSGAAYVFLRDSGSWSQQAYLKGSNTGGGTWFGYSVAIHQNLVVVGAPVHQLGSATNEAYVFERTNQSWSEAVSLNSTVSNLISSDFGASVAVTGQFVAVGAPRDRNGLDEDGDLIHRSGAVHIFEVGGQSWDQASFIKASPADEGDVFGTSVAIADSLVFSGAPSEDSNGQPLDNSLPGSGAAYVYDLNQAPLFQIGGTVTGLAGSGLVLQNNSGDDLLITDNGSFHFLTELEEGSQYSVSVTNQPNSPNQACTVSNAGGTVH